MGYTTYFQGEWTLDRELTEEDQNWLVEFAERRHEGEGPGYWCNWEPTSRTTIGWNEGEKFYEYVEWIKYLVREFFIPRGYVLNGEVEWTGEEAWDGEQLDVGKIIIADNVVTVKEAKLVWDES